MTNAPLRTTSLSLSPDVRGLDLWLRADGARQPYGLERRAVRTARPARAEFVSHRFGRTGTRVLATACGLQDLGESRPVDAPGVRNGENHLHEQLAGHTRLPMAPRSEEHTSELQSRENL